MPNYDDYPIEGYVYDEPSGRPRPGVRYRNPSGDVRVLRSIVILFLVGCVLVGGFAWMERKNTLTEWALGDDRFECSFGPTGGVESFVIDTASTIDHYPEVADAAGLQLLIEAKTLPEKRLVGETTIRFDTREVDWETPDLLLLSAHVAVDAEPNELVGMCDVHLAIVPDATGLPANAPTPVPCGETFTCWNR